MYFKLQIRAIYFDFETHVFIRFLISIKFSIIINHKKKRRGGGGGESLAAPRLIELNKKLKQIKGDKILCKEECKCCLHECKYKHLNIESSFVDMNINVTASAVDINVKNGENC